jgi:hypothetical protein
LKRSAELEWEPRSTFRPSNIQIKGAHKRVSAFFHDQKRYTLCMDQRATTGPYSIAFSTHQRLDREICMALEYFLVKWKPPKI